MTWAFIGMTSGGQRVTLGSIERGSRWGGTPSSISGSRFALVAGSSVVEVGPQAYFWTDEWQEGEREADDDFATGNFVRIESWDDLERFFAE